MRVDPHAPDAISRGKISGYLHGQRFPSLEGVSAAVTRAIRGMNKSGTLNGIANHPKRWDAVIEKQRGVHRRTVKKYFLK
jgi:hypothetical protein